MKLDAVITWVDGQDKSHREKRNRWAAQFDKKIVRDDSLSDKRFDDSNELYYCIHLLRKNATFIKSIFLVTDGQQPAWLTETVRIQLGVIIVDHHDIFGEDADLLPVFNSTSIEGYIHNIKGLSYKFIYLNDDFFVIRPLSINDFFSDTKLVLRGSYFVRGLNRLWKVLGRPLWLPFGGLNTYRGYSNDRLFRLIPFCRAHAPYVCDRKALECTFSNDERRANSKSKFRTVTQLNPLDIQFNHLLCKSKAYIKFNDWFYMTASTFSEHPPIKDIVMLQHNKKIKFICIQELCEANASDKKVVIDFLDGLLS